MRQQIFAEVAEFQMCGPRLGLPQVESLFDVADQVIGRYGSDVEQSVQTGFETVVEQGDGACQRIGVLFAIGDQRVDAIVKFFDRSIVGFVQRHVADQIHRSPKFQAVGLVAFVVFDHLFELLTVFSGGSERSPEFFLVAVAG